jgi:ABC-type branched-subunit amino acid transport system substrate-binding protein
MKGLIRGKKTSIGALLKPGGLILILLLISILVFSVACSSNTATPTTASPAASTTSAPATSSQAATKTLNIGWAVGSSSGTYLDGLHATELMIDQDNSQGGLLIGGERYKVNLIKYDSGITQDTEMNAINRLVSQDKVSFIITQGLGLNAWANTTESNKVIVIHFETAFTPLPKFQYIFNASGTSAQVSALPGWICNNYPDAIKNYVIASPDDQMGHIVSGFVSRSFNTFGANTTIMFYPSGTADFSSVATKVMSYNPTLFTSIGGNESESGRCFSAVRQAGSKALFVFPPAIPLQTLKDVLYPEALEGFITGASPTEFDIPLSQGGKDFKDAWIAKYGSWTNPDMTVSTEYPCLKAALLQAGSIEVDKVAAALSGGMKFDTPQGAMMMMARADVGTSRTVDSVGTNYVKQIVNGQAKIIATIGPEESQNYFQKANPALPPGATYAPPQGP